MTGFARHSSQKELPPYLPELLDFGHACPLQKANCCFQHGLASASARRVLERLHYLRGQAPLCGLGTGGKVAPPRAAIAAQDLKPGLLLDALLIFIQKRGREVPSAGFAGARRGSRMGKISAAANHRPPRCGVTYGWLEPAKVVMRGEAVWGGSTRWGTRLKLKRHRRRVRRHQRNHPDTEPGLQTAFRRGWSQSGLSALTKGSLPGSDFGPVDRRPDTGRQRRRVVPATR